MMTPAAQTSEPQTEAGRELVEIAPQLWRQPSNRSMPMEPMQLEIRKAVLAIESEAQRLTMDATTRLLRVAMTARRMIEDGHPNDPSWFRIMAARLRTVGDLTDAALMNGEDAAIAAAYAAPDPDAAKEAGEP